MIARQLESTIVRPGVASSRTLALASNPRGEPRSSTLDVAGDRPARVLLLGCGTVGSVVARQLLDAGDSIGVELTRVLVRDRARARSVPAHLLAMSFEDAIDEEPDLVIEVLGGEHPACEYVCESLRRGIPVVSANKTLVARHACELDRAAQEGGASLVHEAAACAAIPVFAALRHLEGDRVRRIVGIVNGSCNFILSRMSRGASYEQALRDAAAKGLVEPDPLADVSGRDSAEKLVLLARACCTSAGVSESNGTARSTGLAAELTGERPVQGIQSQDRGEKEPSSLIRLADIETCGITSITPQDLVAARRGGFVIKLLAEYDTARGVARVGPTWIPASHPLASVDEEENAVLIETELAGEIMLRGKGAGPRPTASAILGDIGRVLSEQPARRRSVRRKQPSPSSEAVSAHSHLTEAQRPYYIRVTRAGLVPDQVLSCLAAHGLRAKEIAIGPDGVRGELNSDSPSKVGHALRQLGGESLVCPIWNAGRFRAASVDC